MGGDGGRGGAGERPGASEAPRVVLVTGANSGIGRAAALELARRGATVVIGARDAERGAEAAADVAQRSGRDDVGLLSLDLASLASVDAAVAELQRRHDRLDVLVNNAGAMHSERRLTEDGFEMTFGVNHLGHFHLTRSLLPMLAAAPAARIVTVGSAAHRLAVRGMDFDDLQSERRYRSWTAYGRSKLANLLHTTELARRLAGTTVTANACHPGSIRSGFGGPEDTSGVDRLVMAVGAPLLRSPEHGARVLVHLADAAVVAGMSGGYWVGHRRRRPSRHARSAVEAGRLWVESERLLAAAGR